MKEDCGVEAAKRQHRHDALKAGDDDAPSHDAPCPVGILH
jgi:hypothetical protein